MIQAIQSDFRRIRNVPNENLLSAALITTISEVRMLSHSLWLGRDITTTSQERLVESNHWLLDCLFNSMFRLTPYTASQALPLPWKPLDSLHEGSVIRKVLHVMTSLWINWTHCMIYASFMIFFHAQVGKTCVASSHPSVIPWYELSFIKLPNFMYLTKCRWSAMNI